MAESLAAVITAFGQPLEIRKVPIPDLEPGAMLVQVDAATLCGTDAHFWHGMPFLASKIPYIPGHETCGTIVEMNGPRNSLVGEPLKVGDRIIAAYPYCGSCYYCTVARQAVLCESGWRYGRERCDQPPYLLGGCAQHHYIPPGCDVVQVPDEVPSPLAASAACALRTIMHAFERLGHVSGHESVVVQGAGPVGLYALAVARDRGARKVIVVGAPAPRLEVAREWGADVTLNLDDEPDPARRKEWILEQTSGRGPDIVLQCASGDTAVPEGIDFIRPGGRFVSVGSAGGVIPAAALFKFITIYGVFMAEGRHFYEAVNFLASRRKQFPFERLISGSYPLEKTYEALVAMAEYREVKPVILPNKAA